jgi:hypothetical protein
MLSAILLSVIMFNVIRLGVNRLKQEAPSSRNLKLSSNRAKLDSLERKTKIEEKLEKPVACTINVLRL